MRCFCIGGGESLSGFDFSRLDNKFTIGCNHIIKYYPLVRVAVFLDRDFFEKNKETIIDYRGVVFAHERALPEDFNKWNLKRIRTKLNRDNLDYMEEDGFPVFLGRLSGLTAINIAIDQGFDEIYLLGYDLKGAHYFDSDKKFIEDDRTIAKLLTRFQFYKDMEERYGYKIYNCNPDSAIRMFPFVNIDEVLND